MARRCVWQCGPRCVWTSVWTYISVACDFWCLERRLRSQHVAVHGTREAEPRGIVGVWGVYVAVIVASCVFVFVRRRIAGSVWTYVSGLWLWGVGDCGVVLRVCLCSCVYVDLHQCGG